jgi:hypothetical protein
MSRKKVSRLGYHAEHYKHVRAFLKANKFFKRLTITVDAQTVSIMLFQNSVLKHFDPTIRVPVMTH